MNVKDPMALNSICRDTRRNQLIVSLICLLVLFSVGGAQRLDAQGLGQWYPAKGVVYAAAYRDLQSAYDSLPLSGGVLVLPCGDILLPRTLQMKTRPVIMQGCGASIGFHKGGRSGTRILWTGGPGIALDLQDDFDPSGAAVGWTRGSEFRDFSLANAGNGTVGIRINAQEPKLLNVYVFRGSFPRGFSEAAILVGDLGQVNDFLCRDCYVRWEKIGLKLLFVSEGTIDHSRILQNQINLQVGDPTHTAGNVSLINGTNFSPDVQGVTGLKIVRAPRRLVVADSYCENDGEALCIDATGIVGDDLPNLVVRDSYFAKASEGARYAIAVDGPSTSLTLEGNTFAGYSEAAVHLISVGNTVFAGNSLQLGTARLTDGAVVENGKQNLAVCEDSSNCH
jgi:hypothetical protein